MKLATDPARRPLSADVREVLLSDAGALSGARPGAVLVDMTTSEPSLAVEIATLAKAKGVGALDAPVSGGDIGAREARLSIMCGGEAQDFERVLPLLQVMGKNIRLMGGPGAGQHTKMANQILIATNMIGVVVRARAALVPSSRRRRRRAPRRRACCMRTARAWTWRR